MVLEYRWSLVTRADFTVPLSSSAMRTVASAASSRKESTVKTNAEVIRSFLAACHFKSHVSGQMFMQVNKYMYCLQLWPL